MLALLIMIGAGYFMTRKGMMDEHTNTQMSKRLIMDFREEIENFPSISATP